MIILEYITNYPINEVMGLILICVCLILVIIFIWKSLKYSLLKLIGVFLVVALSLVSNDGVNYFLAILVVATLVTELDFLQNIAAILRNSESYFIHKFQTQHEINEDIVKEADEIEKAIENDENTVTIEFDGSNLTPIQFGLLTEDLTFRYLERRYKKDIRRYVLLTEGSKGRFEVDGIIEEKHIIRLFEIRSSRRGFVPTQIIKNTLERYIELINNITVINKRIEFNLIVIGEYNQSQIEKMKSIAQDYRLISKSRLSIEVLTFDDIGMSNELLVGHNA